MVPAAQLVVTLRQSSMGERNRGTVDNRLKGGFKNTIAVKRMAFETKIELQNHRNVPGQERGHSVLRLTRQLLAHPKFPFDLKCGVSKEGILSHINLGTTYQS